MFQTERHIGGQKDTIIKNSFLIIKNFRSRNLKFRFDKTLRIYMYKIYLKFHEDLLSGCGDMGGTKSHRNGQIVIINRMIRLMAKFLLLLTSPRSPKLALKLLIWIVLPLMLLLMSLILVQLSIWFVLPLFFLALTQRSLIRALIWRLA